MYDTIKVILYKIKKLYPRVNLRNNFGNKVYAKSLGGILHSTAHLKAMYTK